MVPFGYIMKRYLFINIAKRDLIPFGYIIEKGAAHSERERGGTGRQRQSEREERLADSADSMVGVCAWLQLVD